MTSESGSTPIAAAQLPPGIYRISVAPRSDVESQSADVESEGASAAAGDHRQYLTDDESHVTILPPSKHILQKQLWRVTHGKNGPTTVIGRPSDKWPSPFLTYTGDHKKPKEGDRVKLQVFDFPLNDWYLKPVHGHHFLIHADHSELGIGIGPEKIFPPFLILSKRELTWEFEFVHPEPK